MEKVYYDGPGTNHPCAGDTVYIDGAPRRIAAVIEGECYDDTPIPGSSDGEEMGYYSLVTLA